MTFIESVHNYTLRGSKRLGRKGSCAVVVVVIVIVVAVVVSKATCKLYQINNMSSKEIFLSNFLSVTTSK